jgi:hypothetical protein
VLGNPIKYNDPSGHRVTEGCGEDGKYSCTPKPQEIADYNYYLKKYEHNLCKSGKYLHCSTIENEVYNNRPITGIYIGYSGQAGFGLEAGPNIQEEWHLDWKTGDLYHSRTVGGAASLGTPSVMNGQINLGILNVRGIPRNYSQRDVRDALEGPQIDASGAVGAEAIAVLDIGFSRSQDIDQNGKFVKNNGSEMYTDSLDLAFGFDTFPNIIDLGLKMGMSETSVINVWHLW